MSTLREKLIGIGKMWPMLGPFGLYWPMDGEGLMVLPERPHFEGLAYFLAMRYAILGDASLDVGPIVVQPDGRPSFRVKFRR